jgi:hypothetical protein
MYADDSVLIAPSPQSLQCMLNLCKDYAEANDIIYNIKKTVAMCIKPKSLKNLVIPNFCLQGKVLSKVLKYKYLGIVINSDNNDNDDINRLNRSVFACGNKLISQFKKCTENVKVQLFKTFCCNLYCSHLWYDYFKYSF